MPTRRNTDDRIKAILGKNDSKDAGATPIFDAFHASLAEIDSEAAQEIQHAERCYIALQVLMANPEAKHIGDSVAKQHNILHDLIGTKGLRILGADMPMEREKIFSELDAVAENIISRSNKTQHTSRES